MNHKKIGVITAAVMSAMVITTPLRAQSWAKTEAQQTCAEMFSRAQRNAKKILKEIWGKRTDSEVLDALEEVVQQTPASIEAACENNPEKAMESAERFNLSTLGGLQLFTRTPHYKI
jgi:ADP-ribosylglycohydrolase